MTYMQESWSLSKIPPETLEVELKYLKQCNSLSTQPETGKYGNEVTETGHGLLWTIKGCSCPETFASQIF